MASAAPGTTVEALIERALAFQAPSFMPPGDDAGAEVVFRLTDPWALQLANGETTIDAVYATCKAAAMNLQVHTQGRIRWKNTKPFLEWLVETKAERIAAFLDEEDSRATRHLRSVALTAINQGGTSASVRTAIITAARAMRFPPPNPSCTKPLPGRSPRRGETPDG